MPIDAVNDFVIRFANVNGSGSASANLLFARSILRMGVPIAPRNIFPSNIQGLPTWYEVRVSEAWLARRARRRRHPRRHEPADLRPGYRARSSPAATSSTTSTRADAAIASAATTSTVLGMPLTEICAAEYSDPRQRQLYKNIIYVGALAALLDIELEVIETLIAEQFKGKERLIDANRSALKIGFDHAKSRFDCPLGIRVRRSDAVGDRILVEGNFAAGLGAVYGGATVCAWYPITPSTSLAEAFERNCARFRIDPATGKKNYAIVQAEDEIAAIGIAIGAGWNGARAFTATSGPGISLMQEFFGLAYFAEIPVVVFDVQRGGPSTGMPTRTQQSDLLVLRLCLARRHQACAPDPRRPGRGVRIRRERLRSRRAAADARVRHARPRHRHEFASLRARSAWDDSRALTTAARCSTARNWSTLRTSAATTTSTATASPTAPFPALHPTRGAYFTRGTSRDRFARYTEEGLPYVDNMERLERKFDTARTLVPRPDLKKAAKPTSYGVIYFGSTAAPMDEARHMLAVEDLHVDALRIRAFPLAREVADFVALTIASSSSSRTATPR